MDGELDDGIGVLRQRNGFSATSAPLDQHLKVNRAALISAEAIVERMTEALKAHVLATTGVATVEKRAVIGTGPGVGLVHTKTPRARRMSEDLSADLGVKREDGNGGQETRNPIFGGLRNPLYRPVEGEQGAACGVSAPHAQLP